MGRLTNLVIPAFAAVLATAWPVVLHADEVAVQRSVESTVQHYENVERELLAADVSHLTPDQRKGRLRAIEELRAYRESRDFTRNEDFPGARMPYFVDQGGRRCAVAHLLHRFGCDDLVAEVARTDNHAYVSDLAGSRELREWLDTVGLSVTEAARIQAPGRMPSRGGNQQPEGENVEETENPEGFQGPPSSGSGPSTSAPPTEGGSSAPGTSGGRPGRPDDAGLGTLGADGWWIWWELNKLDWLKPNELRLTADKDADVRGRRISVLPRLLADFDHADARVRVAAAVAAGRVGGEDVVEPLIGLLDDSQPLVRERALLALGATGAPEAADVLLRVAKTGTNDARARKSLSPHARGIAVVALAVARRYGLERDVDRDIQKIVAGLKKRDQAELGTAALLHSLLAPSAGGSATARRFAADRNAHVGVRARAFEQLAAAAGDVALPSLQRTLAGRRMDLRRSAAVSLATLDNDLVLPRLMTSYELENEALTRGFLLVSIAERGGEEAVPFLTGELTKGGQTLRPWAALALGLVARSDDSDAARKALASADLQRGAQGAGWLARGLAQDKAAVPALRKSLIEDPDPRTRQYAATALGLIGGDAARFALLERATVEKNADARVVIAQSLAMLGEDADAPFILDALRTTRDPVLQGMMAVALGFHGSDAVLVGVEKVLEDPGTKAAVRATALEAAGLLLDRRPGLFLPALSRRTNFAVMPGWLLEILQVTL